MKIVRHIRGNKIELELNKMRIIALVAWFLALFVLPIIAYSILNNDSSQSSESVTVPIREESALARSLSESENPNPEGTENANSNGNVAGVESNENQSDNSKSGKRTILANAILVFGILSAIISMSAVYLFLNNGKLLPNKSEDPENFWPESY